METVAEEQQSSPQISEWLNDNLVVGTEDVEIPQSAETTEDVKTTEEDAQPKKTSKLFAKIAEKERKLREEQKDLKLKKGELAELQTAADLVKGGDPLKALEQLGGSYEKATEQVLRNGARTESGRETVEYRLEKLEQEKIETAKTQEKQNSENEVKAYVANLKKKAESSDDFALTAFKWEESKEIILETQRQYAYNTGKLLTEEEVLGLVEEHFETTAVELAQHDKIRKKLGLAKPEDQQVQETTDTRRRTRSLRNAGSSTKKETEHSAPVTKRDRLDAALSEFKRQKRS